MRLDSLRPRYALLCALAVLSTPLAIGQCPPRWLSGDGVPGVNGNIYAATTWDPDGDGPQPALLVVGGSFSVAGRTVVRNLATWDGSAWHDVGGGTGGTGRSLSTFACELIVGGGFSTAGDQWIGRMARWDGSVWRSLGTGISAPTGYETVNALATFGGELIVGGSFNSAGGLNTRSIATWNGTDWAQLGSGIIGAVTDLE